MPSGDKIEALREKAQEFYEVDRRIEVLEVELDEKKKRRLEIQHRELPDIFAEAGVDVIGLPDAGVDVKVRNYYKASISSEWEEQQRQEAFAALEVAEGGDLIKTIVSYEFGKGEVEKARELQQIVHDSPLGNTVLPNVSMSVHWGTLTSFVRAEYEAGRELPLEKIGAIVGRIAEIKKRKEK